MATTNPKDEKPKRKKLTLTKRREEIAKGLALDENTPFDHVQSLLGIHTSHFLNIMSTVVSTKLFEQDLLRREIPEEWMGEIYRANMPIFEADSICRATLETIAMFHPLADWVQEDVQGVGLHSLALVAGIAGRFDRYANPAKLWKYMGMHVTSEGTAAHRQKGVRLYTKEKAAELGLSESTAYSPRGRMVCFLIGESIVKVGKGEAGGTYRMMYETKRADYEAREKTGPSKCAFGQVHRHKAEEGGGVRTCGADHIYTAAKRFAVKGFLKDMWVQWRAVMPEGQLATA